MPQILDTLIQFEDFKYPHAYNLLTKCINNNKQKFIFISTNLFFFWLDQNRITCFNDDIQSTSSITLAGILASLKSRGKEQNDLANERIVCVGAGSAGVGVCEGIIDCMVAQGRVKTREEAYSKIYMLDQYGLLGNPTTLDDKEDVDNANYKARETPLDDRQHAYVKHDLRDQMSLEQVVKQVKPTVLLGLTGIRGVFTEKAVREMSKHHEKPVIFPLSNPDTHAECTAEEAFKWTDGRVIFASGSPFKDVLLPNGKIGKTNQCNNSYSFPVCPFLSLITLYSLHTFYRVLD
jgi:malic enzyme